jgi:hypothetical protein
MQDRDDTYSPPQLAKRWGVAHEKVLILIKTGQLRAVNLAVNPKGRPRYRIFSAEVQRFEEARSNHRPRRPFAMARSA